MSRGTRLSVLGLYTWNSHLFDELRIPIGMTDQDRETIVGNILSECAELECLFPDYDYCKTMIGLWSKLCLPTWQRIYDAAKMEYNPIENYNRTEIETVNSDQTDAHSGSDTRKDSGTDTQLVSSSGTETNTGTDTNSGYVTSYDSNNPQLHDRNDLTHGHIVSDDNSGSNSTTYGKTETFTNGESINRVGETTRENHTTGNIGVTTSQQMLEQELEVAPKLNIINIMIESFRNRFCLLVY